MRILIIVCFLIFINVCAVAQDIKLLTFRTDTSIVLRWIGNINPSVTSWNVERSVDGSMYSRINTQPLVRELSFARAVDRVGQAQAEMYLMLFGVDQSRDLTSTDVSKTLTKNKAGFHFALLAAQPELSDLTGERFVDTSIPASALTIRYRVVGNSVGGEVLHKESEVLDRSGVDRVPVPDSVIVEGRDNAVRLRWPRNKIQSDQGDVVGFRVWKSASETGSFEEVTTVTSISLFSNEEDEKFNSWTDVLIDNGETAYYYVRQVGGTGVLGERSEIVRATSGSNTSPLPATEFTASVLGLAIQLSWRWSENPATFTSVQLYRRIADGTSTWTMRDIEVGDTSYLDAIVDVGVPYQYTLVISRGDATVSSDTLETFITDAVAPNAPTSLRVVSDTGRVKLSWLRSTSTDVVGYHVYRSSDERRTTRLQLTDKLTTDTVFTDILAADAQGWHGYFVTAEDKAGNTSDPSTTVVARTIDITPPVAPQIVQFEHNDKSVRIGWTASRSVDVVRYIVEMSDSTKRWSATDTTASTTTTITLRGTGAFRFRIVAEDSARNRSKPSIERTATVDPVLLAPQKLTVVKQNVDLKVSWSAVSGADGYRIVRIDPRTGKSTTCATLHAKETSWLDKFSQRDRNWTYRVAARTASWKYGPDAEHTYQPPKE